MPWALRVPYAVTTSRNSVFWIPSSAYCLGRPAAASLSPRPGEVGSGAPGDLSVPSSDLAPFTPSPGTVGTLPRLPTPSLPRRAGEWRGGGTSPDDSPGVPGTHRESSGPSPPPTPPAEPGDPRAARPGLAPHLGVGVPPGAVRAQPRDGDPRGAGASAGRRRERGRRGVRARGRGSRRHTKKAAGRRGGAGRGRGRQEGAGAARAADKAPAAVAGGSRCRAAGLRG